MTSRRLRAREIYRDINQLVIAIERIHLQLDQSTTCPSLWGYKETVGVVVKNQRSTYGLDLDARPVEIDHFLQEIPELDRMMNNTR